MLKITAIVAMALCGCLGLAWAASKPPVVQISMLLAHPSTYDGKMVEIRGAAVVRFEGQFICPSAAEIESGLSQKCLWLMEGIGEGYGQQRMTELGGKRVVLIGRFTQSQRGHMGAYGGAIIPIREHVVGTHNAGQIPPPPPEPSANNSSKPTPLRGAA